MSRADPWERLRFSLSYPHWLHTRLRRYGFAALVVTAATLARFAMGAAFGLFPPFVLFFPAIIFVALWAGFGPGVFATFLSALSVGTFFWATLNAFGTNRFRDVVVLVVFSAIGTAFSRLADLYRRREGRLREFERVVQGLEEMIVVVDRDYRYVIANDAFLKYRGMKPEQVIGRTVAEVLNPGVFEATVKPRIDECFQGKVVQYEMRYSYPSLGERDLIISYFPMEGAQGVDRAACVLQDVTDKKRAAEDLRASEDRYRDLIEHSEDLMCTHDLEGGLLSVNSAPARILGYEVAELLKIPMRELIAPEFQEQFDTYLEKIKKSGADKGMLCVLTRNGERRIWEYNNTLRTEGVTSPIVRGMAHDMTERKYAEEALRASEERFRSLYENSTIGIYRTTPDGRVLLANPSLVRMLGFSSFAELSQRNLEEEGFQPGYDRADFQRRLVNEGEVKGFEASWTKHDGSAIFVRESAKAIRDTEGEIAYYEGTVEDITERKRAEEAVRQSEERFRVVLKDSPVTVFNQDRELRYTWIYNPSLCWQREIIGSTDEEIMGASQARRLVALKRRVLETGAGLREEVAIPHNGCRYSFEIMLEPLRDGAGAIVGITGAAMDIARLRNLADSLKADKDQLVQEKHYLESEMKAELGFEKIIGQSPALREVLKQARVVASTDSTVLLLGETGTGKELVARAVHSLSERHERNFIKLNCAAVPTGLLESELFGHEKGAFTGAVSQKVGRIELADKGTLFLDEIGELPPELQPKLLRVLQDREFERLGGVHTLRVDVRIIAATNRDLQLEVTNKKFREDLFYRLNVFPIHLPALRQRRADIPMLVHHFVHRYAERMGKNIEAIQEATMDVLQNWAWPGNVRELENMIERMVILTKGGVLAPPPMELEAHQDFSYDRLTEMEREHIIRVLRETNGVLSGAEGAASRLGMKRTTLQSMLKRLGIEPQGFRRGTGTFGPE